MHNMAMEESLKQLVKETSKVLKYTKVHRQAQDTLDFLEHKNNFLSYKMFQIRGRCVEAFQTAIESKNQRLASFAVSGLQHMLKDARFHSSDSEMKEEELEQWFPLQVLVILHCTSSLPEDVQVEVMRLLLNMALSLPQSLNAAVVINVVKLCVESLNVASRQTVKNFVFNTFLRMIHFFSIRASDPDEVMIETYSSTNNISVNTAVKGTFNQLLSSLNDKLLEADSMRAEDDRIFAISDSPVESLGTATSAVPKEEDYVAVFQYICDNLSNCPGQSSPTEPLLLEGILVLLSKLPHSISTLQVFHDLIWQKLCPTLIGILANPLNDKAVVVSKLPSVAGEEVGRGSGCSSNAPAVSSASAKIIYGISSNLIRTLGKYASLRPVFESLFHRMLLYPCPVYRLDAVKSLKPLLSSSGGLVTLCGPMIWDLKDKPAAPKNRSISDMRLIKIIIDSLQECGHCSDSVVTIASVDLVNDFLSAVESLVSGTFDVSDVQENGEMTGESNGEFNDDDHGVGAEGQDCTTSEGECTRKLVRKFMDGVRGLVEDLSNCADILTADEVILSFASRFCSELNFESNETILNADAIYVTAYSALHLSVDLLCSGYYTSREKSLPLSQDQFINEILSAELLLYVSKSWLKEIFKLIISSDVFCLRKYDFDLKNTKGSTFLSLMNDLDGFGSHRLGGQLLSSFQEGRDTHNMTTEFLCKKGHLLARNILIQCWEGILDVLSILTSGKGSHSNSGLVLLFNAKEETKKIRLAICTSLEGLQKAARLSSVLGLQNRCGSVFASLASASCVVELDDIKKEKLQQQQQQSVHHQVDKLNNNNKVSSATTPFASSITPAISSIATSIASSKPRLARLHAAHALSMDVLLSIGLETSSHAPDCWENVFKCCCHISELEHAYFTSGGGDSYSSMTKLRRSENVVCNEFVAGDDGVETAEMYSTAVATEPVALQINVKEVIELSRLESGWDINVAGGGVLSSKQASKVLCGLSQEVDRIFEDAALKLNMKSLVGFLNELCKSSASQLASFEGGSDLSIETILPSNALHLHRLSDIMSRCIASDRPLLHVMQAWSIVSQHLTKAACNKDGMISKKAVGCIHEILTGLLSSRQELSHFHFNEFLCKPFENLLCLELCDGDVQDQIVCSMCELVEACPCNIKSGWKPLFNALRSVRIECTLAEEVNLARQRHVAAVLDVFNVFLATDNVLVFANAAVDCILCLLRYIRGPGEFEAEDSDSDLDEDTPSFDGTAYDSLCLPALKYLRQCANYLASMWLLPSSPVFSGSYRVHSVEFPSLSMLPPNMDISVFIKIFHDLEGDVESRETTMFSELFSRASEHEGLFEKTATPEGWNPPKPEDAPTRVGGSEDAAGENKEDRLQVDDSTGSGSSAPSSKDFVYADAEASRLADDVDSAATENHPEMLSEVIFIESLEPEILKLDRHQTTENLADDDRGKSKSTRVDGDDGDDDSSKSPDPLSSLDNPSGVLHVYHLLVEGLTSAVFECSKNYQPQTLETLFELIRTAAKNPGPQFAFHCFNNILLPTLQSWTRRGHSNSYWNSQTTSNCKHFTGLSVDLLAGLIVQFVDDASLSRSLEFMLHQQMAVLIEFVAQPIEFLSRLGCSCIRHCLMNCGFVLSPKMWDVAVEAVKVSFDVTLFNLRCLVTPFQNNSDSFYGDVGQVKVAVRQDSTPADSEKLQQLSLQVFLLDCQQDQNFEVSPPAGSDKSFIFLIYSPASLKKDVPLIRIPFRSLVVSLVSHQLLIQTLGSLLLNGTSNIVPLETVILYEASYKHGPKKTTDLQDLTLPGMLEMLACHHALSLLECLKISYKTAEEFDQKPGLKFLIQKILGSDVSANLYRHAGLVMTLQVHALLEVVAHHGSSASRAETNDREEGDDGAEGRLCSSCRNNVVSEVHSRIEFSNLNEKSISSSLEAARHSGLNVLHFVGLFGAMLREALVDISSKYTDLFLEKEGSSIADRLSSSMLVFLQVEHDELPTLKKEKSLKATDKLRKPSCVDVSDTGSTVNANGIGRKASNESPCDGNSSELNAADKLRNLELVGINSWDQQQSPLTDDKICKLASDQTLKVLVGDYRKRKQSRSMPTSSVLKSKLGLNSAKTEVDQELSKQQKSSYLKDSEAHLRSRAEVLCNILQLFDQLSDKQYTTLLPLSHRFVVKLAAHSTDPQLRQAISRWISRVGRLYKFAESDESFV